MTTRVAPLVSLAVAAALAMPTGASAAPKPPSPNAVAMCGHGQPTAALQQFRLHWNVVIEPIAIERAYREWWKPPGSEVGFNKFFVYVRAGHKVTMELSPSTRRNAALMFGRPAASGFASAHRVVSFVSCPNNLTRYVGFLFAKSPRCVPLRIWVDGDPQARTAALGLGVRDC